MEEASSAARALKRVARETKVPSLEAEAATVTLLLLLRR
jgi:hypothetical protein|tara:strand:- start:504 stop:620 length:117 start_codon:yes stop_codon:yes gene_type:complete